jgi:hypothetical protein
VGFISRAKAEFVARIVDFHLRSPATEILARPSFNFVLRGPDFIAALR